jgi:hypothetical protein
VALDRMPRAGHWMNLVHKASIALIIVAGVYYLYCGIF